MIRNLVLRDFRNYEHLEVNLSSGVHLVVGQNAQGKTNLIEAVALLSSGRVLRGMKDTECIREGCTFTEVIGELADTGTELKVRIELGARKKAFLNSVGLPRASDLIGRMPCVVFTVQDLDIVRDDPSVRRTFLDTELCQVKPGYLRHLAGYKRALEQRNALLRHQHDHPAPRAAYEAWEAQLGTHGEAIIGYRTEFVEALSEKAASIHAELASGEVLRISYAAKCAPGTLEAAMAEAFRDDVRRGTTTVGPHRDDLDIWIGGREGRLYGSQGQQRTAAIALKLGTLMHLRAELGERPVVLLDDVLSELDIHRREHLLAWVSEGAGQTLLTCNEASLAGKKIEAEARVFEVKAGNVTER